MNELDIVVVTNHHRPALITKYLEHVPHLLSYTEDLQPLTAFPNDYLNANPLGAYRCFKGHQKALAMSQAPYVLVFEDDAVPRFDDWMRIVDKCLTLLHEDYNCISLHGRDIMGKGEEINHQGVILNKLNPVKVPFPNNRVYQGRWALGSLAYMLPKEIAQWVIDAEYDGTPVDLFIANLKALVVKVSPFDHCRKHGSLVEQPK